MSSNHLIEQARALLSSSRHAIALTGAGISTASGIPDFRSPESGLWQNADPFEVASIYSFRRRPQDFYDWIHPLARLTLNATPNPAHTALAQLEKCGWIHCVITQNVDALHTKAGSSAVYEVHGHFREMTCLGCYSVFPAAEHLEAFVGSGQVPLCSVCGGVLKPNVILIGEQLPIRVFSEARRQARECDLMIVVGSSLAMAPAGDLPALAVETGAKLLIINREHTHLDHMADVVIIGDAVDILPELASTLI